MSEGLDTAPSARTRPEVPDVKASTDRPIILALSGGGFRAALFHLGVIRYLYDRRVLHRVRHICSVSGGSIVATLITWKWHACIAYANPGTFDKVAGELIAFVRRDVRGRIVRRWLFSWLFPVCRVMPRIWNRTELLKREYSMLYMGTTLGDLKRRYGLGAVHEIADQVRDKQGPTASEPSPIPTLHLLATSMSDGSLCEFTQRGFSFHVSPDDGAQKRKDVATGATPCAIGVAASSAFPPVFPPVVVSPRRDLGVIDATLVFDHRLTDGGVFDNLGLRRAIDLKTGDECSNALIINSDAESRFEALTGARFRSVVARTARTTEILMKNHSELVYRVSTSADPESNPVSVTISHEVLDERNPSHLDGITQRYAAMIRTDLDEFSWSEVSALVRHGYCVAEDVLRDMDSLGGSVPGIVETQGLKWIPSIVPDEFRRAKSLDLRRSDRRRLRLWTPTDGHSWLACAVCALYFAIAVSPYLIAYRRTIQAEAAAAAARKSNEILALGAHRQDRMRPIRPGISIGTYGEPQRSGTICCFLEDSQGSVFLLSQLEDHWGEEGGASGDVIVLQPSSLDGGDPIEDVVASVVERERDVSRLDRPESTGISGFMLARLHPGIDYSPEVAGFGPIQGVIDPVATPIPSDMPMVVVGRTGGAVVAKIVNAEDVLAVSRLNAFDPSRLNRERLIALEGSAGVWNELAGDLGSPVLTLDGDLVGMVCEVVFDQFVLVRPIVPILEQLRLNEELRLDVVK